MAKRPIRPSTRLPKTLAGVITALVLAVLAALGVKTDWFHGKPSASPTERPPVSTTTPAPTPGNLPHTPASFDAAKKILYAQVYADHRVTFYCGCTYSPDRQVDLASCGLETLADKPRTQRIEAEHIFPAAQFGNSGLVGAIRARSRPASRPMAPRSRAGNAASRSIRCSTPPTMICSTWYRRWVRSTASAATSTGA